MQVLDLRINRLSGEIPPELGRLANLEWLELHTNQLSGEIPPELGRLANLTDLSLVTNELSGEIPAELGNLSNLRSLWLVGNQLSGTIPAGLGNLSNLESLGLAGNRLSGCIPEGLRDVGNNDLDQLGLPFCGEARSGPYVVGKPTIISRPSHDTDGDGAVDTYGPTGIIEIRVEFSEQVCGTGSIFFTLQTGNSPDTVVEAPYSACGTDIYGSNHVYFQRLVDRKDLRDGDGISIPANAIRGLVTYDGVVPNTAHPAVPADPNHKFDGSLTDMARPTLEGASMRNHPANGNTFRRGEVIEVEARFSEPVTVRTTGGLPVIGLEIREGARRDTYDVTRLAKYSATHSSATALVFIYTVQAGDKTTAGRYGCPPVH